MWSWKRALGVTRAKRRLAATTGIPLTKSGRKRKAIRTVEKGCLGLLVVPCLLLAAVLVL